MAKIKISGAATKTRKPRMSRASAHSADEMYMGPEPMFRDEVPTQSQMARAFNWYNYMFSTKEFKVKTLEWLKTMKNWSEKDIKQIKKCPDHMFMSTLGTIAWMQLNGSKVYPTADKWVEARLQEMMNVSSNIADPVEVEKDSKVVIAKPTIQDRMRQKAYELAAQIDDMVDQKNNQIYDFFKINSVTPPVAKMVVDLYRREAAEVEEAAAGTCDQLNEGYSHFKKKDLKALAEWWKQLIEDGERYYANQKATRVRKTRKPKERSAAQLTQKIKYQREFIPLKIVSVDPALIVGAMTVMLYNTKYRQLTVLTARTRDGLTVKGTTIINYGEDTSWSKRLRKPEDIIKKALTGGQIVLRKLSDSINTQPVAVNGRVNENTILLRVIR